MIETLAEGLVLAIGYFGLVSCCCCCCAIGVEKGLAVAKDAEGADEETAVVETTLLRSTIWICPLCLPGNMRMACLSEEERATRPI
jgi:hypothetical protein